MTIIEAIHVHETSLKFHQFKTMNIRVNRLVTEHLVSQSPLSYSICLLSTYTLKIKYSPLENALIVIEIAQYWSKMRKIHSFKVGGEERGGGGCLI